MAGSYGILLAKLEWSTFKECDNQSGLCKESPAVFILKQTAGRVYRNVTLVSQPSGYGSTIVFTPVVLYYQQYYHYTMEVTISFLQGHQAGAKITCVCKNISVTDGKIIGSGCAIIFPAQSVFAKGKTLWLCTDKALV